jgi:CDP-2,3-bis-(O-geranylgeranyl)-sn-glycerol synthase
MMIWSASTTALLLLIVANLLPWTAGRVCGSRWDTPLDLGLRLWDRRRLLGDHKTWRGVAVAIAGRSDAVALVAGGPVRCALDARRQSFQRLEAAQRL